MKNARRIYSVYGLSIILILIFTLLTGCQSTDKSNSFIDTSSLQYTEFIYDANKDQTKVVWEATLTNDTIFNFDNFSITFKLYNQSNLVKTDTYHYNRGVKHGEEYTGSFNFYVDGKIDSIEYVSWTANYISFWDTYKIWIIAMSVVAGVATLIYIIVMIVKDLEFEDIWDATVEFFSNLVWVAIDFSILFAGIIFGIITSYWVPILIVLGGIVAFIVLVLLAQLIKFIVVAIADTIADNIDFGICGGDIQSVVEENKYFDSSRENIADYIDDENALMLFTVEQLKEYCKNNEIKGYSSLNKPALVDLIIHSKKSETEPLKSKKNCQTTPKKISKLTFDDIAGLDEAKNAFREKVVYAFLHKDLYEKYGKKVGGGLLLYGLPGTGKTMFAEAASNETDSLFIPIKCSDIKSKWYGESETNVKSIFLKARKAKKAIIFFDEFEAIGAKRTDDGNNLDNNLVPQILAEMQGVGSNDQNCVILVIAATNKPWMIDSAFLRPGRFDEKIYIPLPDFAARKKLFQLKLQSVPQEELDYDYLANITDGFNCADIGAFCDKLKMLAIKKSIADNIEYPITMQYVKELEGTVKSTVSDEDIVKLLEFKEQYS